DTSVGGHYFHGDGSEHAVIKGIGFGSDSGAIQLSIGETVVPPAAITSVSDGEIEIKVPKLFLSSNVAALPVRITKGDLSYIKHGAIVVLPRVVIEDANPLRGPPQGGNVIDIYGRGFNHGMRVTIGGKVAGDLRVISGNHVQVRAPANPFGYAQIKIESLQFAGESAVSPIDYFYAGRETGSVDLASDKPSPISAVLLRDQILYTVTGGEYEVINREGRLAKRLRSNVARLIAADVSDPVRPVILEKEFSNVTRPYHFDVTGGLGAQGFVALEAMNNDLFAVGSDRLYHFDITLAADPLLINEVTLAGQVRDLVARDGLLYVSSVDGVSIYQLTDRRELRRLAVIDRLLLKATPHAIDVVGDSLWISLTDSRRIVEVELMSGEYRIVRDFETIDEGGNRFKPRNILVKNNLILVSSGTAGSVVLYQENSSGGATPVASLNLAYLVRNGDIYAGQMILQGQTLYVAAGQGDLQLYDISPWMEGRYKAPITLKNY